eukprot:gb/GECH01013458.1/.p1 GENE.gb/GECH01013458.1/~~gb/GECH01013458.1/.p1  ORF type:complete len:147 (+),score=36.11 gb/GECH01013458.1/:1-441(+)
MPKVRTKRKRPPEGWDEIEDKLLEFEARMRDVQAETHEGKRSDETLWPIMQINHEKSRYIYNLYYKDKKISRELYDYCLREGYADAALIAKWKKTGYEKLCCLQCIQPRNHNFGGVCICRVPKSKLAEGKVVQCTNCGCRGCASSD